MDWNLNSPYWVEFLVFGLSLVGLWLYLRAGKRWGVTDQAGQRSSHKGQVVTGAGIVLMSILCVCAALLDIHALLLIAIGLLAVVGFIDDKIDLIKGVRLLAQLAAVALVFYALDLHQSPWWWVALMVFLTLWWINLFNFMDGANGMAGLHILVCAAWYVYMFEMQLGSQGHEIEMLGLMAMLSAGAYLMFNFPSAALFMGDSGSLPYALILAILALTGLTLGILSYWQVAVLHAPLIADASFTLIVRVLRRERFLQAHNTHVYQRIIRSGWPHWQVSGIYALLTALLGLLAWWMRNHSQWQQIAIVSGIYALLLVIFMKSQQLKR